MRADYDSLANAVSIDLIEVDLWDDGGEFEGSTCTVAFSKGRLANVSLLDPGKNLALLAAVAERFDLDADGLTAAAKAALAAPNRTITLGDRLAA